MSRQAVKVVTIDGEVWDSIRRDLGTLEEFRAACGEKPPGVKVRTRIRRLERQAAMIKDELRLWMKRCDELVKLRDRLERESALLYVLLFINGKDK